MNKSLFRTNLLFLIGYFISVLFIGLGIYIIVIGIQSISINQILKTILAIVVGSIVIYIFSKNIISNLYNRIILSSESIIVSGDLLSKNEKIQFFEEIKFAEIKDLAIIYTNANSMKVSRSYLGISNLKPLVYFEFMLKNGESKLIYIEGFSKKQRQLIVEIVNEKAELALSYDKLERKDYSIYRRNKKKK